MSVDPSLIDWISEAVEPLGSLTWRNMMGGATLYIDGIVFAIITADGVLHFKADKMSDAIWDAEGCPRFTFDFGNGRIGSMNYRRAPDEVHDDADALRHFAALGLEAGRRVPPKKPRKTKQ